MIFGVELPEFRDQDAGELKLVGDSGKAALLEWGGVIGELGDAEAGEDAEGEVESADEDLCGETHEAGWDPEVGD